MRVRLVRIEGADLNLFDFDFDLTWTAFFMNADGAMYGRFGGRDAKGPDTRNTLAGLRYAMERALETHQAAATSNPKARPAALIEQSPAARKVVRNGCIHCHQVSEIRRREGLDAGTWKRDSVWVYPLPENIGITLDKDQGNRIAEVKPATPAARAGLRPGDLIETLNQRTVFSFADAQYALHYGPMQGTMPVSWSRGGKRETATLELAEGWKKTNVTWRPSMLDLLPSLTVFGYDMTVKEKAALGLDAKRLAFRQVAPVHTEAQAIGVREGDVIVGINDQKMEMTALEFLGHVRQNYIVGERLTLNLLRDGKKLDLRVKLK